MKQVLIFLLRVYRVLLSPFFGRTCRFYPSCSAYAIEAIEKNGCRRGIKLAARRLSKCHVFNPGGYDPVPSITK